MFSYSLAAFTLGDPGSLVQHASPEKCKFGPKSSFPRLGLAAYAALDADLNLVDNRATERSGGVFLGEK
jgi:hypothetical protein